MADFFNGIVDKAAKFWGDRTMAQRAMIGGLALSVILAFGLMIFWLNQSTYQVLYSNLFPEDASRVVSDLSAQKIPYKLTDGGKTIMVPAESVYELRLKLAGEGALHGQGIGFEIFDQVKIGQTDFIQRINYQRALQGELSRTITEFPQVERCRVHLVIPSKSLFLEEQMKPSASVVLQMSEGEKLEPKQLKGIVNLVSMSVEGLDPSNITITDTRGQFLYEPSDEDSTIGASSHQLDYKRNMERGLERSIDQLLMPVVGPNKIISRVNADLDFSQRTIHQETYDPESSVIRSEQKSEETTKGTANIDAGVPEANFRGDEFGGTVSTQDSSRETSTVNYEINKEETKVIAPVGELKRLSVAVVVDGSYQKDEASGEQIYVPRSQEELDRIKELVKNTVGFDEARGDSIEVSTISFGLPELYGEQTLLQTMVEYMQRLGKPFLNGLLIFLFLILVVRPVIMALIRPRVAEQEAEEVAGLPESDERLALAESEIDEEALDAARRLENAKAQALQLSEKNMDQAVQVLKRWLKQEA